MLVRHDSLSSQKQSIALGIPGAGHFQEAGRGQLFTKQQNPDTGIKHETRVLFWET